MEENSQDNSKCSQIVSFFSLFQLVFNVFKGHLGHNVFLLTFLENAKDLK